MTNGNQKGKRGERFVANWLRATFGLNARRGQQYCGANGDADVVGGFPNTHCEVKFVESLNLNKAMEQAIADCNDEIPYIAHKKNRCDLLITVRANDLMAFAESIVASKHDNKICQKKPTRTDGASISA